MSIHISNSKLKVSIKEKGGELQSIQDASGREYLWQGDPQFWSGQAPVLFPICGSIRNNCANLQDGQKIQMPRHGIVRKREFTLKDSSENQAVFYFHSDEETRKQYPFDFVLESQYKLENSTVIITYIVINTGTKVLPFTLGAHPGFKCPLYENEVYEDYDLIFEQKEILDIPYQVTETGLVDRTRRTPFLSSEDRLPLNHDLFSVDAIAFDHLKSKKIKLVSRNTGKGLEVQFDDFENLVLWGSDKGGDFVAIEPWSGMSTYTDESDVFEQKQYMKFLEPGGSRSFELRIRIIE